MKIFIFSIVLSCNCLFVFSQDNFSEAWQALNNNDRKKAETKLAASNITSPDEFISRIYLNYYNGKDADVTDFQTAFYDKVENPYPYVYALWFHTAVLGGYGKKSFDHQLKLIERIMADPKAPGSLKAASFYQKGFHEVGSNNLAGAQKSYKEVGNIRNWQFVGPFENLSGSGINKDYGPLEKPQADAIFYSMTNAPVRWFQPSAESNDGWTPVSFHFHEQTAVVYAQTFVNSNEDQEVLLNAGFNGAVRVWLNDELILNQKKELVTELDAFTVPAKLKKGTNRILVQLAYRNKTYPNFAIRLTDRNHNAIKNLTGSSEYKEYNKVVKSDATPVIIPHFAEAFFLKKVNDQPDNLLNYLLLSDVYKRNMKTTEARKVLENALAKAPANNLVRIKLVEILILEENRTAMLSHIEQIKQTDPESLIVMDMSIRESIGNEKYDDAEKELLKRERLFGETESTINHKLSIFANQERYEELLKIVEDGYKKYPENESLFKMMYEVIKQVYKDNKKGLELYEDYLKRKFNYGTLLEYSGILDEQGQTEKALNIKLGFLKDFPYDPIGYHRISQHYYAVKEYSKAEDYIRKAMRLAPYNETYWSQLGDILSQQKKTEEAIGAFKNSLQFDPNQYEVINKMRKLLGKEESYKLLPQHNIDDIIQKDEQAKAKNTDYGYYIIHDGRDVIVHPGGGTEIYSLLILRITNEKGIESYKESSISYSSSQSLLIEKAELLKASGTRIQGERNDNTVIFTTLEVGDVVIFKYRLQNYTYGRFGKDFTDKFEFNGQIYTGTSSYNLLLPAEQKLDIKVTNGSIKPEISSIEGFKKYSWVVKDLEPLHDEPVMPVNGDIGMVLHISTISDWQQIANWYADILNNKTEEEFEISEVFNKLFPDARSRSLSQYNKARIIYNYIEKNVRYSSVPFRQSAFVPQTASNTLNTKLGDCKDMSNLFVTLCRMAGIESQMVLVDTRDNGALDMILPSIDFNHCIAKVKLDNKSYYIELTDNNLAFASLPNFLLGALILEIPTKGSAATGSLMPLVATNRPRDMVKRTITIKPQGTDLLFNVSCQRSGYLSSGVRSTYANLESAKQMKEMGEFVASQYKHNVKLESLTFSDLKELNDSVTFNYTYKVKDEVAEIGSLNTFRIAYPDVVATLNNFSSDERIYPIEYINYEDADNYETIVQIELPAGKKFVELPIQETHKFGNMQFSIRYQLVSPNKLTITRKFVSERKAIPAEKYLEFKTFFEKIIKAEQKMIAYR